MKFGLLYLILAFVFASEILLIRNSIAGIIFYSILLIGVLFALAYSKKFEKSQEFLLVFMILPLSRIASCFLSLYIPWKAELMAVLVLGISVYYIARFKINLGSMKKRLWLAPFSVIFGISLGIFGNLFLNVEKTYFLIAIIPIAAFSEELFFRGLLQNLVLEENSLFSSALFISLLYGAVNISLGFSAACLFFAANFVICLIYGISRNLILGYIINLILSFSLFALPKL